MARKHSLSGLLVMLFAVVAALVAVVFTVELVSLINLRDDTTNGRRGTDRLTESYNAALSVLDPEPGLGGFLLTRQQRFLQPSDGAETALAKQELPALERLASGAGEKRR